MSFAENKPSDLVDLANETSPLQFIHNDYLTSGLAYNVRPPDY